VGQPAGRGQGKWENRQDDSDQQRSENLGQGATGVGATSDRYDTSGQSGGRERFASDQTSGSADPTIGRTGIAERDDDLVGTGTGGKPSATSKVMGTAEKLAGKITGDPGKQARGEERKEGMY